MLKAKNHQIIGQSEMYESAAACENGVSSVRNSHRTGHVLRVWAQNGGETGYNAHGSGNAPVSAIGKRHSCVGP